MSIRLRLTLLYSAILAITLIVFSVVSYITVAQDSFKRLVNTLQSKAERIAFAEQFNLNDIDELAHQFAGPEFYVQTRETSGVLADRSPNLADSRLPLNEAEFANSANSTAWFDTVFMSNERFVIYNLPITNQTLDRTLLQISSSLTDYDRSLGNLAQVMVVGNVLVILLAFTIGWRLAGVGLRPIFRLAEVALEIGQTRNFARRVNYDGADDEIGQLAHTFDQMLSELEDAHQQTERSLKAQKRFVADASHELRTPLTTIRGNMKLLNRQPPISEDDRREVLNDLDEETDRLIRLVNNLLVLARADIHSPILREKVQLQSLMDNIERQVRQLAPEQVVCFDSRGNEEYQSIVLLANEDALKQVLLILIDNAIKHTPSSARISVTYSKSDANIEIQVYDTGLGIPDDQLARIFDRFYVVDTSRTQNSTGLGLAIAKSLIESHSGQLTVQSVVNQGTCFTITLPLKH